MKTRRKLEALEAQAQAQQFLTFRIRAEHFGLALEKTREILEYGQVTQVPLMPNFLHGIINLRGDVVPVIDLAVRLGRAPIDIQRRSCIIVVELTTDTGQQVLGLLADAVSEVIDIEASAIEDTPAFGAQIRAEFIQGIAKYEGEFIVLLNADEALSIRELAHLVESQLQ